MPSSTPFWETAWANASARRIAVAGSSHPATGDQRKVDGDAADVLRVEHVHRPRWARTAAGQGEDVGLGGGGDHRAGVAQDDVGEERGLVGARRGHHQQVLLQRDPQPVPVVRPAQEHRMLAAGPAAVRQRERRGGSGRSGAARRSRPHRSHRLKTWAKPLPGCSRRCSRIRRCRARLPGRWRAGRNAHANAAARTIRTARAMAYLHHEGSPFWAARTALRSAVRAAPVFRPAGGASSALIGRRDPAGSRRAGRAVR